MEFDAVIFDMDGVIFDSEKLCIDLWKEIAEREQIPDIEETMYQCIGVTSEVSKQIFHDRYGADFPIEEYQRQVSHAFHEMADRGEMPIKSGVESLLRKLNGRGIVTALASSTRTETVMGELAATKLIDYFRIIIGGDMVEKSKPNPDIFLEAAKQAGMEAGKCIVIEDSHNGIRAAKAAGMTAIMVPDLMPPNEEMNELADYIFPSLMEVEKFLLT